MQLVLQLLVPMSLRAACALLHRLFKPGTLSYLLPKVSTAGAGRHGAVAIFLINTLLSLTPVPRSAGIVTPPWLPAKDHGRAAADACCFGGRPSSYPRQRRAASGLRIRRARRRTTTARKWLCF